MGDIQLISRVLQKRLVRLSNLIDPCPDTFLPVTREELNDARKALIRLESATRCTSDPVTP